MNSASRTDIYSLVQTNNIFIRSSVTEQYQIGNSSTILYSNDSLSDICTNVVAGVIYYIETSQNNIPSIKADIYLFDKLTTTKDSSIAFEQFFQVKYVDGSVILFYNFIIK